MTIKADVEAAVIALKAIVTLIETFDGKGSSNPIVVDLQRIISTLSVLDI